jgi:hypothetical protein
MKKTARGLAGLAPAAVMQAEEMPSGDSALKEIVAERALTVLRRLVKRGTVVKFGTSRNARWAWQIKVPRGREPPRLKKTGRLPCAVMRCASSSEAQGAKPYEPRMVTEDDQPGAPLDVFKNKQISCQIIHRFTA